MLLCNGSYTSPLTQLEGNPLLPFRPVGRHSGIPVYDVRLTDRTCEINKLSQSNRSAKLWQRGIRDSTNLGAIFSGGITCDIPVPLPRSQA